jgi:hypothetical protein
MKTIEPPYTERYIRWCGKSVDKELSAELSISYPIAIKIIP